MAAGDTRRSPPRARTRAHQRRNSGTWPFACTSQARSPRVVLRMVARPREPVNYTVSNPGSESGTRERLAGRSLPQETARHPRPPTQRAASQAIWTARARCGAYSSFAVRSSVEPYLLVPAAHIRAGSSSYRTPATASPCRTSRRAGRRVRACAPDVARASLGSAAPPTVSHYGEPLTAMPGAPLVRSIPAGPARERPSQP
jgi:hypothetical protein